MRRHIALFSFFFLAACGATTPAAVAPPSPEPVSPAEVLPEEEDTCVGQVDPAPAGLEAQDEAPPGFALGAPGKGALCEAKVFSATAPVVVYRLFSASYETSKRAGPLGAYWTFEKPSGTPAATRASYAICVEWNDLDSLNECQIDVGAEVVIGPGQSAKCDDGTEYPQSAENQVLIVRTPEGKVPVSGCKESPMTWGE